MTDQNPFPEDFENLIQLLGEARDALGGLALARRVSVPPPEGAPAPSRPGMARQRPCAGCPWFTRLKELSDELCLLSGKLHLDYNAENRRLKGLRRLARGLSREAAGLNRRLPRTGAPEGQGPLST